MKLEDYRCCTGDNDDTDNMVETLERTISDLEKENRDLKVALFS